MKPDIVVETCFGKLDEIIPVKRGLIVKPELYVAKSCLHQNNGIVIAAGVTAGCCREKGKQDQYPDYYFVHDYLLLVNNVVQI